MKSNLAPVPGTIYRNSVKVTITNHSGHLGNKWGSEPKADSSLPVFYTEIIIEEDETAIGEDNQICPDGFTYTASNSGPLTFNDSRKANFTKSIKNFSAANDRYLYLNNPAILTERD